MRETIIPLVEARKASIATVQADAIVNPSNSFGYMGGGVAKVIKNIGGQVIEDEAIACAPIQVGEAIMTTAGDLVAKKVIHAPTMHDPASKTDAHQVRCAVEAALSLADENNCRTVAIPGMGTGVGGLKKTDAAKAMIDAIRDMKFTSVQKIILLDTDEEMVAALEKELGKKR